MRGNVVERAATGLVRIQQPGAEFVLRDKPHVAGRISQHRLADYALANQFHRAMHLGIGPAIVGHAQRAAGRLRRLHHHFGFGIGHGHGLFAQHVAPLAQCNHCLWRVHKNRRGHINGLGLCLGKRLLQVCESRHSVRIGFRRVAGDDSNQLALFLFLNRRQHPLGGNVSNSNNKPFHHAAILRQFFPIPRKVA